MVVLEYFLMNKQILLVDVEEFLNVYYHYLMILLDEEYLLEDFHVQLTLIKVLQVLVEQDELHEHIHLIVYVYLIKFDRYLVKYVPNLVMLFHLNVQLNMNDDGMMISK